MFVETHVVSIIKRTSAMRGGSEATDGVLQVNEPCRDLCISGGYGERGGGGKELSNSSNNNNNKS